MTRRPLRVGIVGTGRILAAHLRGYQLARDAGAEHVRIAAVVSSRPEQAAAALGIGARPQPEASASRSGDPLALPPMPISEVQPFEPLIFDDLESMLRARVVDALDILLPVRLHHEAAIAALEAGLHVMIQKPVAISMAAARAIEDAAARRPGSVVSVMENLHFDRASRLAHLFIADGGIGQPRLVDWFWAGPSEWAPDRVAADTPWRHRLATAGGGASIDMGVHMAHRLGFVVGRIEAVAARAVTFEAVRYTSMGTPTSCDADDTYAATVSFRGGAIGTMSYSWAVRGARTEDGKLHVMGSHGALHDDTHVTATGNHHQLGEVLDLASDARLREWVDAGGTGDAFAAQYLDWCRAIDDRVRPEVSLADGMQDLAVALAIGESTLAGCEVDTEDVRAGRIAAYQEPIDRAIGLG